jgi:hypothetical protein|tara:strand:- start:234 stop:557 length:324 start_codon:yes stop_codon:yes gene_type:complete
LDHAKNHGVSAKSKHLPEKMQGVPCPHCNSDNVQLKYVSSGDKVRSYDTSPATKLRLGEGCEVVELDQNIITTPNLRISNKETPEVDSSSSDEAEIETDRSHVLNAA